MVSNLDCRILIRMIPNTQLLLARYLKDSTKSYTSSKDIAIAILSKEVPKVDDKAKLSDKSLEIAREIVKDFPEEPPVTCCMSGCANCVWLDYAEKLSDYYKDGGEKAEEQITNKIQDTNVRAFLLHEIRMRKQQR